MFILKTKVGGVQAESSLENKAMLKTHMTVLINSFSKINSKQANAKIKWMIEGATLGEIPSITEEKFSMSLESSGM